MDINNYKFNDEDIEQIEKPETLAVRGGVICFAKVQTQVTYFTKDDVIAMAQHFNVTEYDLSC